MNTSIKKNIQTIKRKIVEKRVLLWHRRDLRLTDHEPLQRAVTDQATVFPCYCFDDREFGTMAQGFPKTGAFRAQFIIESVADLRQQYRSIQSDLIIRRGLPEIILPALIAELGITDLYFHHYPTTEEQIVERAVLQGISIEHQSWWGHTLYLPQDLPGQIDELPELFTKFRKQIEGNPAQKSIKGLIKVREPWPAPTQLQPISIVPGELPQLADLGLVQPEVDDRAVIAFPGGETAGKQRLQEYFWKGDRLKTYKETRNGMVGADYSSKFSPWLALGCLSPRWIYQEVQRYEQERVRNESTYWLIFELLWRDYFAFIAAKHGAKIFQPGGLRGLNLPWKQDIPRFELWCQGRTGFPLVDANMRELSATGFMSNRGRQNVASFLTKNLGIDWRWGAEWFESLLIDYDPASNWGNWNYTAGIGNDARGFRFFNIYKQSKDYDPQGTYVKLWLPELAGVPAAKVHDPSKLQPIEQQRCGVQIGVDYPRTVVDLFKSAAANEQIYNDS
jgi:deoxyribodipyrimidine photo-lyase